MDRMNAYERVMGVLSGKRPDYPPVVPHGTRVVQPTGRF